MPISVVGQGAGCMWTMPEHKLKVVFMSVEALGGGLDNVRANRAYHDEVEIESYPAVFSDFADKRPEGSCNLWVGVADGLVMKVNTNLPEGPDVTDPCSAAKRIAMAVASNLGTA